MSDNFFDRFHRRAGGRVRAITMWDFSWLERRWPGAGYEDWGAVLDELVERGYDAVRIDAYPHLHAKDPGREWDILPCWNQQVWGSPARNRIRLQPHLNEFIGECAKRGIMVGLSSWYQDDTTHARLAIPTPEAHALQWVGVLDDIASAGLLENILFVDLCNEWPFAWWAPFFNYHPQPGLHDEFGSPRSVDWMTRALKCLKDHCDVPATFSLVGLPQQVGDGAPSLQRPLDAGGAIATSNFCGPQFVGMWGDIEWHRRLTNATRQSTLISH